MTEQDVDGRLRELLARPTPDPDPRFVKRVVLAAEFDRRLAASRHRSLQRALVECGGAVVVGAAFYLMSQMSGAELNGMIVPSGPAMAGLIMLALWCVVALPLPHKEGLVG